MVPFLLLHGSLPVFFVYQFTVYGEALLYSITGKKMLTISFISLTF